MSCCIRITSLTRTSLKTTKSVLFPTKTSFFFTFSSFRSHQTLSLRKPVLPSRLRHRGAVAVRCFGALDAGNVGFLNLKKVAFPYMSMQQSLNYGRFAYRDVSSDESDYELGSSHKEMTGSIFR